MRHRPLCMISLFVVLVYGSVIVIGGAKFVKELRPSMIETYVPDGENIQVSGMVYQKEQRDEYQLLYLKDNSVNYQGKSFQESKLIIYDKKKEKVNIGNIIVSKGAVSIYQSERNPGNFSQKLYYQKQDIHAMMCAESIQIYDGNCETNWNMLKEQLSRLREKWKEHLCEVLGEKNGSTLTAMLLGEKSEMDAEVKELYQVNGIGHVLAISGLHLSVIGIGLYQVIRRMTGSYTVGGVAGICFLTGYIVMIGMGVSVVRAYIMFLFRVGADLTGRKYDNLTALTFAAVVVLAWRPLYVYDGGFWMSFGAVFSILVIASIFHGAPMQSFWASVSINAVLFPVQLYFFYEFPIYSVCLNLWVIPLMSILLFLGITGSVISMGSCCIGDAILRFCNIIFGIYERSCEIIMRLPGARIAIGQPKLWQILGYYGILGVALLLGSRAKKTGKKDRKRAVRFQKAGVVIACIALGTIPLENSCYWHGKLQVTVIDVGQGDGIFLRGPTGKAYMIDGGSSDVTKVGKYRIEPFLRSQGVKHIEYLFCTHGDADHTNGWIEIMKNKNYKSNIETIVFPVKELWDDNIYTLAEEARSQGVEIVCMQTGSMIEEGDLRIECLGPGENFSGEKGNASSLLLRLNYREFDMLFTGDTEEDGEKMLIEKLRKQLSEVKWEALKVSHHGSRNSSSEELLQLVKPRYALISAGQKNSYGHPHQETLQRLKYVGSNILVTKDNGAITLITDGEKMWIKTYL